MKYFLGSLEACQERQQKLEAILDADIEEDEEPSMEPIKVNRKFRLYVVVKDVDLTLHSYIILITQCWPDTNSSLFFAHAQASEKKFFLPKSDFSNVLYFCHCNLFGRILKAIKCMLKLTARVTIKNLSSFCSHSIMLYIIIDNNL